MVIALGIQSCVQDGAERVGVGGLLPHGGVPCTAHLPLEEQRAVTDLPGGPDSLSFLPGGGGGVRLSRVVS